MPGRLCSTPIEGCTKLLKRDGAQIEIRPAAGVLQTKGASSLI